MKQDMGVIHSGNYLTVHSDGRWYHKDGRFLSFEPDEAHKLISIFPEGHPKELDSFLLHYFVLNHVIANPHRYG